MSQEFRTQILSLVSGKGGSGKTALAISMANMMAILGYKVLLVDLDFNTHGLSYFFEGHAKKHNVFGILDAVPKVDEFVTVLALPEDQEKIKAEVQENLREIPLKLQYTKNLDITLSKTHFKVASLNKVQFRSGILSEVIKQLIKENIGSYSYVILDNQAGPNSFAISAMEMSDKYIIVAEADSLSIAAARNLEYEIEGKVKGEKHFVLNKVFPEEIKNVEAASNYLRLFDHLSPIPFDFEVRKSFSLKQIPFDDKVPTPYSMSIIRFIKEVFPELSAELSEKKESLYLDYLRGLEKRRAELEKQLYASVRITRWSLSLAASLATAALVFFIMFGSRYLSDVVVLLLGASLAATTVLLVNSVLLRWRDRKTRAGRDIFEIEQELRSIDFLLELKKK